MEKRNLIAFFVVSLAIMVGWNYMFPPPVPKPATTQSQSAQTNGKTSAVKVTESVLKNGEQIQFETDVFRGTIDADSGDIRNLTLTHFDATEDASKTMTLFGNKNDYIYVPQTGLLDQNNQYLFKDIPFVAEQNSYKLTGDQLQVKLTAKQGNFALDKIYTFTKGSYKIELSYVVHNLSDATLTPSAVFSMLRDNQTPKGESYFAATYVGPVVYTPEGSFEKVSFKDLDKDFSKGIDSVDYVRRANTGWIGMIQHYFIATWLLEPKGQPTVCGKDACQFEIKKRKDGLYSSGVRVQLPAIAPEKSETFNMSLYAGPADYKIVTQVADKLELTKDYGKVYLFATPLFWLLNKLHAWVQNWGWAIVLLTVIVKLVLYPLTAASYRSMAKMRAVAPRLQLLKEQCGDDKMKLQQEMMALYKKEKINPLGGCLPIVLQIPVFIGLYWALFASVELRQAPWVLWIHDLARPDPFYVLPILMAVTMFIQTFLNPPPPDPLQAKMMKIMPIMFSVMFFFFPAGLVLYWVVNNILSITQQWLINRKMKANPHPAHHKES
ncbi:membrane protein insertase YidC [Neisseria sp. Ec49-e6-T10]|uniref:membrane protein insertase YidC n=1 Tax=Neisseria sp. Ec49-e6-T10 TaxID=3140744 RepID=UPI003EBA4349